MCALFHERAITEAGFENSGISREKRFYVQYSRNWGLVRRLCQHFHALSDIKYVEAVFSFQSRRLSLAIVLKVIYDISIVIPVRFSTCTAQYSGQATKYFVPEFDDIQCFRNMG